MENYYNKRNMLNELDLGCLTINDLAVGIHWFHMLRNVAPYNRRYHSHTSCEMHFMISGKNRISFPEGNFTIGPGDGLLVPARKMHRISSCGDHCFSKYDMCLELMSANSSEMNEMLSNIINAGQIITFHLGEEEFYYLDLCLIEAVERKSGFLERIQINLINFLILLSRQVIPDKDIKASVSTRKLMNDERLEIIEAFIHKNMNKRISASDLAAYMCLSNKQINRIIKSGEEYSSATEMIARMKAAEAKKLLANPNLLASNVAEMLGFSNEYYFNKFFKKVEGLPPGRYRETICAKGSTHDRE